MGVGGRQRNAVSAPLFDALISSYFKHNGACLWASRYERGEDAEDGGGGEAGAGDWLRPPLKGSTPEERQKNSLLCEDILDLFSSHL